MILGHGRTLRGVRRDFAKNPMEGFNRIGTWIAPEESGDAEMFLLRERHSGDDSSVVGGTTGVDRQAFVWPKPLLVAQFRYLRETSRYWTVWTRDERRLRSKHGRSIP